MRWEGDPKGRDLGQNQALAFREIPMMRSIIGLALRAKLRLPFLRGRNSAQDDAGWSLAGAYQRGSLLNKSSHSGLKSLIKSFFFWRTHFLSCFSLLKAGFGSGKASKYTSFVTLYLFVKLQLLRSLLNTFSELHHINSK